MKILFLTHHWSSNTHHSGHSGYQELIRYFSAEHECTVVTCGEHHAVKQEGALSVHYVKPFIRTEWLFSKRFAISRYAKNIEQDYDVVHALYTDCGYFQRHPNFFSTLHISPGVVNKVGFLPWMFLVLKQALIERRVFARSRKVFLVSCNLKAALGRYAAKGVFIPHGVNTGVWDPRSVTGSGSLNLPERYVLCVGNNGVDKACLESVIRDNPGIPFVLVGIRRLGLSGLSNVIHLSGIKESELKEIYARASLFIRPMNFATANNSILEAMSMNRPVLISTPDGRYDYFQSGRFLRSVKTDAFLNEFRRMLAEAETFNEARGAEEAVRKFTVDSYDWSVIAGRIMGYYGAERN